MLTEMGNYNEQLVNAPTTAPRVWL